MITTDLPATTIVPRLPAVPPGSLPVPPDQNPAVIYLSSLGDGSRRTMRTALNTIAALLGVGEQLDAEGHDARYLVVPWASLRATHTSVIRAVLLERYAPATANKVLAALRRVLREARRLGQISAEDYEQAIDIHDMPAKRHARGRLVDDDEVATLLQVCSNDPTPAGARDAAVIALLRGTGLRRAELVALDLADYDSETGALIIRGKTEARIRVVYPPAGARAALADWILVRGKVPGPLFYGLVKGGSLVVRRLAGQAVAVVCSARADEAGVAAFTPHDIRRTYISGLLATGIDIATVQRLAGHYQLVTTLRYDRRSEMARQHVSELVHVPHFPREL